MPSVSALWTKHRKIAKFVAGEFFIPGWDRDDVEQEATIALWEAARTWDSSKGASFPTFARIVIRRRLVDRLKTATNYNNRILSEAVRDMETGTQSLDRELDSREMLQELVEKASLLTPRERIALSAFLNGAPSTMSKSHDRALTRARKKLAKAMEITS